eukprot:superscaffoldBa00006403_g21495
MELYLDLYSQPCRAVFLFAKAVGIPFEFKFVNLSTGNPTYIQTQGQGLGITLRLLVLTVQGQQYGEEFGKLTMMRKVPVMKDGSFVLTESIAILKYMVQKHAASVADHWYPADLQQRARVNEYLSWQHMGLRAQGSKVFLLRVRVPDHYNHDLT